MLRGCAILRKGRGKFDNKQNAYYAGSSRFEMMPKGQDR